MRLLALLPLLAVMVGCAAPGARDSSEDFDPGTVGQVSVSVAGTVSLDADRGRPAYIVAVSSPRLTAAARDALSARGHLLVETREHAEVVYVVDGAFQAYRPVTRRRAEVRLGNFIEQPGPLKTVGGRGATIVYGHNPLAAALGTIVTNVGSAIGARDAVNEAAAGDPDGQCVTDCERWLYRQRAVVNLSRTADGDSQTLSIEAHVVDADLRPEHLFRAAFGELEAAAALSLADVTLPAPAAAE